MEDAGLFTASEYLNLLNEVVSLLCESPRDVCAVLNFATGAMIEPWKRTVNMWKIEGEESTEKLLQLALIRRFPKLYDSKGIKLEDKIRFIEEPVNVGERLFRNMIEGPPLLLDVVQKGFASNYIGHDEIVTPVIKTLSNWASLWSPDRYFAPYTCLVGPTMIGKSRLLMEMAEEVCVVYICLRPVGSTGEPPRSELATEMLEKRPSDYHHTELITAILSVALDFFKQVPEAFNRKKTLNAWNEYQKSTKSFFYSNVQSKLRELVGQTDATSNLCSAAQSFRNIPFFKSLALKVVLAIDEASALLEFVPDQELSLFRMFRRSLREIPNDTGIFAILVDTTSRVSNFMPNSRDGRDDRSSRAIGTRGGSSNLYPPIYELATFDLMVDRQVTINWNNLSSPERLFNYGVPFFGQYLRDAITLKRATDPTDLVEQMIRFALKKLLFSENIDKPIDITEARALALLGPTIGVPLHGQARLNVELTASHAAHCGYLDRSAECQYSFYPSQPIYAIAANNYLYYNEDVLVACIKCLAVVLSRGCIDVGAAGEFASRIILLCAMNKTVADLQTSKDIGADTEMKDADAPVMGRIMVPGPIPVAKFLETLTGISANELPLGSIDEVQKHKLLYQGMMFWNHFIYDSDTPTSGSLMEGLHRGLAVQCKPTQKSFDQVLTIYLKDELRDALDEKDISFCGIQVKNRESDDQVRIFQPWMTPENAGIKIANNNPYLALYFSLNYTPQNVKKIRTNPEEDATNLKKRTTYELPPHGRADRQQASLVFHELDAFDFLSPKLKEALKYLIHTRMDLVSRHTEQLGIKYARQFLLRSHSS